NRAHPPRPDRSRRWCRSNTREPADVAPHDRARPPRDRNEQPARPRIARAPLLRDRDRPHHRALRLRVRVARPGLIPGRERRAPQDGDGVARVWRRQRPRVVASRAQPDPARRRAARHGSDLRRAADRAAPALDRRGDRRVARDRGLLPRDLVRRERIGVAARVTSTIMSVRRNRPLSSWSKRDGDLLLRSIDVHTRSKRSRFITLAQAATKSWTNFACASELAYTSASPRNSEFETKPSSTRVPVHFTRPVRRSRPSNRSASCETRSTPSS